MIYGSVSTGSHCEQIVFEDELGWECAFVSEIDKYANQVIRYHAPDTPNLGDFSTIEANDRTTRIELLCGGTPCQAFSVAGLRKGLEDSRGNLTLEFLALADRLQPTWILWENVPGVLSQDGGRAFGAFLGGLAEVGYGFAYRVLDAQYFGVPQRRRRVFVVGHISDWRRAAAVLFESESMQGHPAPSREAGQGSSAFTPSSFGKYREGVGTLKREGGDVGGGSESLVAETDYLTGWDFQEKRIFTDKGVSPTLSGSDGGGGRTSAGFVYQCHGSNVGPMGTIRAGNGNETGGVPFVAFNGRQDPCPSDHSAGSLDEDGSSQCVAFAENSRAEVRLEGGDGQRTGAISSGGGKPGQGQPMVAVAFMERGRDGEQVAECQEDLSYNIEAHKGGGRKSAVAHEMRVRRLMPVECERLQGWPDGWTEYGIDEDGEQVEISDTQRYKIIGNGWALPVVRWIAHRIDRINA